MEVMDPEAKKKSNETKKSTAKKESCHTGHEPKYEGRPKKELEDLIDHINKFSCKNAQDPDIPCLNSIEIKKITLAIANLNEQQVNALILTEFREKGADINQVVHHYSCHRNIEISIDDLFSGIEFISPREILETTLKLLIEMSTRPFGKQVDRPAILLTADELKQLADC